MLPMKEAMTKQLRSLLVHWRRNNTVRALALLVLLPYFTWIAKTLGGLSVVSETSPSPDFGIYPDVPSPRNASEQSSAANVTVQALSVILAEQNTTTTTTTATSDTGKQPRSRSNVEPENPSAFHSELQSFYNTTSDGTNLWDDPSSKLPSWMKRYLNWHKHQRAKVESSKTQKGVFSSNRFLVMYCSPVDNNCGGTSDRLKPIPFMLRIAYYTKRLLFIHWTKPARLEEFLVPPKGGLDWRLPDWMAKEVRDDHSLLCMR